MCKYTVHVTPHTHSSKVCVVSVREAVVFLSHKDASTSSSTSSSRVSLKSSTHRRGVRSITQEQQWQRIHCFTWRAFPTIWPSLLHKRGRNGKVLPTLSKWIQLCQREMGFITESWRILNSKSCTKDNKDGRRTERKFKSASPNISNACFMGHWLVLFFCQDLLRLLITF